VRALGAMWIARGFMPFQLARRTGIMVLMVPTWLESGFREGVARLRGRGPAGTGACGNGEGDPGIRINGESSGKDGVNTNGRSSLVFFELRRVTCGVVVHKAVDNYRDVRITGGILWTRCGQEKNLK
jgi:hypothetical protein